jgi:hypothetical protein
MNDCTNYFKSQKSVAAERTPEAPDFADRLHFFGKDAHVIELAVNGTEDVELDCHAIVLALRKLQAEIDDIV